MSQEVPDFQSNIPEHLLTSASPQDKYIMENISILNQKSNWLTETQKKQSESLAGLIIETAEIKAQTTKTNGRVSTLEEQAKESKDVVKFYKKASHLAHNKIFLSLILILGLSFFTYVSPWLALNGKGVIGMVIKWLVGA